MTAWLTGVKWDNEQESYKLYFDFTDFEEMNDKYFRAEYSANHSSVSALRRKRLEELNIGSSRQLYTAKEIGVYDPKYSVNFVVFSPDEVYTDQDRTDAAGIRNDSLFNSELAKYIRVW